jgi:hypothetical protein
MAYILNSNNENFLRFVIPEIDVQAGGSYILFDVLGAPNEFILCTAAYIYTQNQTIPYVGWNQYSLAQTGGNDQAYIQEIGITGGITPQSVFSFAINVTPGLFGSFTNGPRYAIDLGTPPTAGNGDLILDFYYRVIFR